MISKNFLRIHSKYVKKSSYHNSVFLLASMDPVFADIGVLLRGFNKNRRFRKDI